VLTSLEGKSAFPENHELALGAAGLTCRARCIISWSTRIGLRHRMQLHQTSFGLRMPRGQSVIHATLDPAHLDNETPVTLGLIGDAALTLEALQVEVERLLGAAA